jgi:4-diphosphocytidyl-2-C-methyl-D-erythritol kinase
MNELYSIGADAGELKELGLKIGSDVPFMLTGGTAYGQGRGEILEKLPALRGVTMVLVTPPFGVSAASAYASTRIGLTGKDRFIRVNCSAIREGDVDRLAGGLRNDLETGVVSACPEIAEIRTALLREGAVCAVMSGSGPTVIGLARSRDRGERIAARLAGRGWTINVVAPIDVGLRLSRAAGP